MESSRSLECELKEQCGFHQFLKMYCSFWPHDAKSRLDGKDLDAGEDCGQEKRATEDEMVGWHYPLNEQKFEKTLGDSEGQGSLVCCSLTLTWWPGHPYTSSARQSLQMTLASETHRAPDLGHPWAAHRQ